MAEACGAGGELGWEVEDGAGGDDDDPKDTLAGKLGVEPWLCEHDCGDEDIVEVLTLS